MNIINIALYTIKRNFRDRKSLSSMLLLPIVLILILGTALNSQFTASRISKTKVAYINLDNGEISKQFENFLYVKDISDLLEIRKVSSYEEGERLLEKKEAASLILIEKGYTESIMSGKPGEIKVYHRKSGTLGAAIVQNVVDSFIDGANTMEAVMKLTGKIAGYTAYENLKEVSISFEGNSPRAIDYYAVTMLVMTLMYGTMYGCFGFGEDFFENIGKRMRSTPVRNFEIFLGKTLGSIFTLFLQAILIIVFSKIAYGANWGGNIGTILLISFSLSFLAIGIGVMVAMLSKDHYHASRILNIMVPMFTMVSGGYAKFGMGGKAFEAIKSFVPNQLGHTAFFNTVFNGSTAQVTNSITVMWIITLIVFIISAASGRRLAK